MEKVADRGEHSAGPSTSGAARHYSTELLLKTIKAANEEERFALSRIVDPKAGSALEARALVDKFCRAGGHGVMNAIRGGGPSYLSLLLDVVDELKVEGLPPRNEVYFEGLAPAELDSVYEAARRKIPASRSRSTIADYVDTIERKLLAKLLVAAYQKLDADQRKKVDAEIAALARKLGRTDLNGVSAAAALLVLGNLGGFATYTLMSVLLGAVSAGTLGFGAYVFASSALSVILGPVGWLGVALYAGHKFASGNMKQTLQLVATIAMVRQRLRDASTAPR